MHVFLIFLYCLLAFYGVMLLAMTIIATLFVWNYEANIAPFAGSREDNDPHKS